MNKDDLQKLVDIRVNEAKILLDNKYHLGAYYLLGYAVECALKAIIAKKVKQYDFPDRKLANDSHSHKISELAIVAEISEDLTDKEAHDEEFKSHRKIAKDWSEKVRYDHGLKLDIVHNFFNAVLNEKSGVLTCLKKYL